MRLAGMPRSGGSRGRAMMRAMRFGVQVPQEGVPFDAVLANARRAEELGYDTVFIPDHLRAVAMPAGSPAYEGWTTLTGVLMRTPRVHAGLLVGCEAFRPPAWFANALATLQHMSGGRVIAGLGAGWCESEYHAYGYQWVSGAERVARLAEYCEALQCAWRGEGFAGSYYSFGGTPDLPKPDPMPPVWIGGQGPKLLEVVARYADGGNGPAVS